MTTDACFHSHRQDLLYLGHFRYLPVARLANEMRRSMLRMTEMNELCQLIDGTFWFDLFVVVFKQSGMARYADRSFGITCAFSSFSGDMAVRAVQF